MDDAGVLPEFTGVAVHDGWKPYRSYSEAIHALCGAHHLRELMAAKEAGHIVGIGNECFLLDTEDMVDQAKAAGRQALDTKAAWQSFSAATATVIAGVRAEPWPGTASAEQRIKRPKAQNLLLRLDRREREDDALRARLSRCRSRIISPSRTSGWSSCNRRSPGSWRTEQGAERYLTSPLLHLHRQKAEQLSRCCG